MPPEHKTDLFTKNGVPVGFYLHNSIRNRGQILHLTNDILENGGRVVKRDIDADTILVFTDVDVLRTSYNADPDPRKRKIYVENIRFVQKCIKYQKFEHRLPEIKGMGGRRIGRTRNVFTADEDDRLCHFLAMIVPVKEAGGRTGMKIYDQLMLMATERPDTYKWVEAHTAQSWRERYKKNQDRLDPLIEAIVAIEKPARKQLWPEDRRVAKWRRKAAHADSDEDEDYNAEEADEELEVVPPDDAESEKEFEVRRDEDQEKRRRLRKEEEEEESDDEVEIVEEVITQSKKRRRSGKDSFSSPQTAKKARRSAATAKGKEKAVDEDEEEEADNTSLFSVDKDADEEYQAWEVDQPMDYYEPGPSGTLPSPDRTLAEPEPRSRRRSSSPSFLTQDTLLNSTQIRTNSREEFEPMSHSTSANRRVSANTTTRSQHISQRAQQPVPHPKSPSPPPPAQPRKSMRMVVEIPSPAKRVRMAEPEVSPPRQPTTTQAKAGGPSSQQAAAASKFSASKRPRMAARRPPEMMGLTSEAPYRNTRSRSRSADPVAPLAQPKARKGKKKKEEEVIPEEEDELLIDDDDMMVDEYAVRPVKETIEEERDVEELLTAMDPYQSVAVIASARPSERSSSLSSDDAQTKRDLRTSTSAAAAVPPQAIQARGPPRTFTSNRIRPADILMELDYAASNASSRRDSPRAPFQLRQGQGSLRPRNNEPTPSAARRSARPRQSEPVRMGMGLGQANLGPVFKLPANPQTPEARTRREWTGSDSSRESFPVPGTRASEKKRSLQEKEKLTPYKPLSGTRAAEKLAMSM